MNSQGPWLENLQVRQQKRQGLAGTSPRGCPGGLSSWKEASISVIRKCRWEPKEDSTGHPPARQKQKPTQPNGGKVQAELENTSGKLGNTGRKMVMGILGPGNVWAGGGGGGVLCQSGGLHLGESGALAPGPRCSEGSALRSTLTWDPMPQPKAPFLLPGLIAVG